jgi:nucleoside-diphosphate-sugar epimerase
MRVVVTGGSGYLGSAIVRALARAGHTPVVFARRASLRLASLAQGKAGPPAVAIDGDIRSRADVARAVEGTDAVIHSAALVSIWQARRSDFQEVNVGGLQNVLDVCGASRISRIVYTSSFLALPPAGAEAPLDANDYQRTKAEAYRVARAAASSGMPIVTLVPGVIYGPGPATEANLVGRLIADHLAGRLPGIIGAARIWSCACIDDVADAHVKALVRAQPGEVYAVGGENVPQERIFDVVNAVTGRPRPRRLPYGVATMAAAVEEFRARITGKAPLLTRGAVDIFRYDWPLDSSRSVAELSYRVTPLADGIRAVIAALGGG